MQTSSTPADDTSSPSQARQVALSMLLGSMRCDDLLRHRLAERLKRTEHRPLGQVA